MNVKRYKILTELKPIVETVEITGKMSFRFNGEDYTSLNRSMSYPNYLSNVRFCQNETGDDTDGGELVRLLAGVLYGKCYCSRFKMGRRGKGVPVWHCKEALPRDEEELFVEELSRANCTFDVWDRGWVVCQADPHGTAFVQKDDQLHYLAPDEFRFADQERTRLIVGTPVDVKVKREENNLVPGYYFAYSEAPPKKDAEFARLYWNIDSMGVPKLISRLTASLNNHRIPFRFKCLNHPDLYPRTDSAILYLEKSEFNRAIELIVDFLPSLTGYFYKDTPLFCRELARGLSFAEDPIDGGSFGLSRSDLLPGTARRLGPVLRRHHPAHRARGRSVPFGSDDDRQDRRQRGRGGAGHGSRRGRRDPDPHDRPSPR